MIIFAGGEIFGKIKDFYKKVLEVEKTIDKKCDWVLQTGDFGIFPSSARNNKQIRKNGNSDFEELYTKKSMMPRATLFVAGKHEDNVWLNQKGQRSEMEILSNLHWLMNGNKTFIGDNENQLSVCGLGRVFSPATYKFNAFTKK